MHTDSGTDGETVELDAYSDYELVSRRVSAGVHDAVESYSLLVQNETAGVKVSTVERVRRRASIIEAATILLAELEAVQPGGRLGDAVEDWTGQGGYIEQLRHTNRLSEPDWFGEFVSQIRWAAWELGYLKTVDKTTTTTDDTEEFPEVAAVVEGMWA